MIAAPTGGVLTAKEVSLTETYVSSSIGQGQCFRRSERMICRKHHHPVDLFQNLLRSQEKVASPG
jgi:hypothetical protein